VVLASGVIAALEPALAWHGTGRLQGVLGNPNDLGTFLWMYLAAVWLFPDLRLRGVFRLLVTVLSLILLVLTGSRASIGALLCVVAVVAYKNLSFSRLSSRAVLASCALTIGVITVVAVGASRGYLISLSRSQVTERNSDITSGRLADHNKATALIQDNPLFGLGLGNGASGREVGRVKDRAVAQLGFHLIAVEAGIPGLMLAVAPILIACIRALKLIPRRCAAPSTQAFTAALLGGFLVNCLGESYIASAIIYPTLLAWCTSLHFWREAGLNRATLHASRRRLSSRETEARALAG
jgi:O-antigen ligase